MECKTPEALIFQSYLEIYYLHPQHTIKSMQPLQTGMLTFFVSKCKKHQIAQSKSQEAWDPKNVLKRGYLHPGFWALIFTVAAKLKTIHPLSVTAASLLWGHRVFCCSQSQLSLGEGRVHPGQVASSSQRVPCKVPTAHQEQFVQCLAQGHFDMQFSSAQSWDLNQRPSDH